MNRSPRPSVRCGLLLASALFSLSGLLGCSSGGASSDGMCTVKPDSAAAMCQPSSGNPSSCSCSNDDYAPRFNQSANDTWPACVSDSGVVRLIGPSLPAAASRSVAFDSIAGKLWRRATAPTPADFTSARDDYSIMQGIGSRVARRQDVHYPELPGDDKFACSVPATAAMYPDRCYSPARLKPILDDAFALGQAGTKPQVQAARVEAALLWFFYLSVSSEIWTCSFDDIEDCDSAWGYFDGARERGQPIGLAAYFKSLHQETYDRGFDSILAVRCWRDLDSAMPSVCSTFYDRTQAQVDKALTRGMALILRDRLGKLSSLSGEAQEAALTFIQLLGGFLDRAARAVDPGQADILKTQTSATTAAAVNVASAQAALDALFPCP
ncbi:MAG TPA: hypothetical protein PKI03_18935 [Pseudomonadota bacterium]|nr:hypothetical protein [Pseudomonadota bacterium]